MTEITKDFKDLLEAWNIEAIIEAIDNAYEQDVMRDLLKISQTFLTTIESQKEEIEGFKAITELAVNALKWYADAKNHEMFDFNVQDYSHETTSLALQDEGITARTTLSEIERLQNE